MAAEVKQITSSAAKSVGNFRKALQDLLVPELRAVKASVEALTQEMRLRTEQITQEMRMRDTQQRELIGVLSERFSSEVKVLSDKLDTALDVRERLIALEARLPRLQ